MDDEYLIHYGVKGMRWGIRKDPDRTYHKAMKRLGKYDKRASKAKVKLAKRDRRATKLQQKAQSYQTGLNYVISDAGRSDRAQRAARRAAKAGADASRAAKKQARYMWKAQKMARNINKAFDGVRISDISDAERKLGYSYAITSYNRYKRVSR